VYAAESAVRHQHHDISNLMLAHDGVDDGGDLRDMTGLLTAGAQIIDQLSGIEPLCLGQSR
jgi:hypothetical protein